MNSRCSSRRIGDLRSLHQQELRRWLTRSGVERLETRRLLAATLGGDGTLTVQGTANADNITISPDDQNVFVTINNVEQTFSLAGIARVSVLAGAGDDIVAIDQFAFPTVDLHPTILGEAGNDSVFGSPHNDSIDGGDGNDTLRADAGSDTLRGGNDNDALYGDTAAPDTLDGGAGPFDAATIGVNQTLLNDEWFINAADHSQVTVNATDGADMIEVTSSFVSVNGYGLGLDGAPTVFTVNAKGGNDFITMDEVNLITVHAGEGNDTFFPFDSSPQSLLGEGGNDSFQVNEAVGPIEPGWDGGTGTDRIDGQTRDGFSGTIDLNICKNIENVDAGAATSVVIGNAANNRITGVEAMTMQGGGGNDTLIGDGRLEGGAGNDSLQGLAGNDTLDGGTGADVIKGGAGIDWVTYATRTAPVTVGLGTLNDDGEKNEKDNVATDIEIIRGGSGADSITGSAGANTIYGGGGNDTLRGSFGNDVLYGEGGNDSLLGESDNDYLDGADGNDTLDGGPGKDTLVGGTGSNTLRNGEANSAPGGRISLGSDGTLLIVGTKLADDFNITTDAQNDIVVGVATLPQIAAFSLQQTFSAADVKKIIARGLGGNDRFSNWIGTVPAFIEAGDGNDQINLNGGKTHVDGGAGNDTVTFVNDAQLLTFTDSSGVDSIDAEHTSLTLLDLTLYPTIENALLLRGTIIGNAQNNRLELINPGTLRGGNGNDTLLGSTGNDSLLGEGGTDSLVGGLGNDTLDGGTGTDTLDGGPGTDSLTNGETTITTDEIGGTVQISPDRTLIIEGSNGNEEISFSGVGGSPTIQNVNFNSVTVATVNRADFDRIIIHGLGGDDGIAGLDIPMTLDGGAGNDYLAGTSNSASLIGGDGNDSFSVFHPGISISGGLGDDLILISPGQPAFPAAFTDAGGNETFDFQGSGVGTFDMNAYPQLENAINVLADTVIGNGLNNRIVGNASFGGSLTLLGMGGNDTLIAGEGNDSLDGGAGDDVLDGGSGGDTLKGGTGNDTADYSIRLANLTIGIGTLSDDGEVGEKDNVYLDIETVLSGLGDDKITGGAADNLLVGDDGNDTLLGNFGNDRLLGGFGNDSLDGGPGKDTLDGGADSDKGVNDGMDILISIESS